MNSPSTASAHNVALAFNCTVELGREKPQGRRAAYPSYEAFRDTLRTPMFTKSTAKERVPLYSPSTFKGDYRNAGNFESAQSIGHDFDKQVDIEGLREAMAPFKGFIHSTSNHTSGAPRLRSNVLLSRAVNTEDEFNRVWTWLTSRFEAAGLKVDGQCKDCSRQFYCSHEPKEGTYIYEPFEGGPLDVDAVLAVVPLETVRPRGASTSALARGPEHSDYAGRLACAYDDAKTWPVLDGDDANGGQDQAFAFSALLMKYYELPFDAARAVFDTYNKRCVDRSGTPFPWDDGEIDHKLKEGSAAKDLFVEGAYSSGVLLVMREVQARQAHGQTLIAAAEIAKASENYVQAVKLTAEADTFLFKPSKPANNTQSTTVTEVKTSRLGVRFGGWDTAPAPIEYLVEGVIPKGAVGMFVAHGDSLKTMTAISMALAVARGDAWLGKFTTKPGKAILVDYENGRHEIHRRVNRLLGGGPAAFGYCFPDVPTTAEAFWAELEAEAPAFVVIDGLASSTPGVDENDKAASLPLTRAKAFAEKTGATVLFIHHANKGDRADKREQVRGSSSLFAALDFCYRFDAIDETESTKRMKVSSIKTRAGKKPMPFEVSMSDKGLIFVEEESVKMARQADSSEGLQAAIKLHLDGRPMGVTDLAKALGKKDQRVREEVNTLLDRGELAKGKGSGRQKPLLLNTHEHQRQRVLQVLREGPLKSYTDAKLAVAACVTTDDIERLCKEEVVARCSRGYWVTWENRAA